MLVSVVIPARADEPALPALLEQLPPHRDVEIIVSRAGDVGQRGAALRATRPDVLWIESDPGRGPQLNAGAARARATWIWFLHADSRVPEAWLDAFRALDESTAGGHFSFALDSPSWQARVLEAGVRLRVGWWRLPYGDQGIFVRRAVFTQMGGFAPLALMEDVDFVRRLKRQGPIRHLSLQLTTSARRYEAEGWWRRSMKNLSLLALYHLGASTDWLARKYYRT
jgi:rSAM/selenodomain-associated transferase 2